MTDLATIAASLGSRQPTPLTELFAREPARMEALRLDAGPLHIDFTKQQVDLGTLGDLLALAGALDVEGARARLFARAIVNPSEHRAATHWAERLPGADAAVERLAARVKAGDFGKIRSVIHIGIGGSALGPALVLDALRASQGRIETAVVSNVDGEALAGAVARFRPKKTLILLASKSFTTAETLLNARSAVAWLAERGIHDPLARVVAVTAAPAAARDYGIRAENILPFDETVGGRFSLWSPVGASIALSLGLDAWRDLLTGARAMDEHFASAPLGENAPVVAALIDLWNAVVRDRPARAVFPYDERLRLLPAFLQQLEMESNGKRVDVQGRALRRRAAPVTWGATGTDAQHAVFQLMHQGVDVIPAEFIGVARPGHGLDPEHHRQLLLNMLAQGAALMRGRSAAEAAELAGGDPALAAARSFPGDRPSTTILLDELTPYALGALLAFYEHRTFAYGVLTGVNPFDQWGVELGKDIARSLSGGAGGFDPSTEALMERAGVGA
ncbi:MAG: glucose-6-phosphate isomerase [Sphingomonadaceae bacterium]|nr:glucose-6-phosphate isomerase [Sphingomonadaceae bacterium]